MKRLIEFDLGDGTSIWIEAEEPEPEGGTVRAGRMTATVNLNQMAKPSQLLKPAVDTDS